MRGVVARLTRMHETRIGAPKPWKMTDSSPEYIAEMIAKVVGIEIEITRMVGRRKLSQNKDERDRVNAAHALRELGEQAISGAMLESAGGDSWIAAPDVRS